MGNYIKNMSKKTQQKVREKTIGAMALMAEYNYVAAHNLARILGNRNTVYKYLFELERQRFIVQFPTKLMPTKAWCLSVRGYRFLRGLERLRVSRGFKVSSYRETTLRHTLACVDVQIAMQKHPQVLDYQSTKVLNANKTEIPPLQPDAEFMFSGSSTLGAPQMRAAVEVEISQKNYERNLGRIHKYSGRRCASSFTQSNEKSVSVSERRGA